MQINSISFFGSSVTAPGDTLFETVKAVARGVAKTGRTIVHGGGPGIMAAATIGAKESQGKIQIVYYKPELASRFEQEVHDIQSTSAFSEEANYITRTKKLLELGDAYIVFNGGTGTISEFAMAWGVARLYIDHHKPLLLYGNFWSSLMNDFKHHMMIRPEEEHVYTFVNSPEEVLAKLDWYEKNINISSHKHLDCKCPECSLFL